MEELYRGIEEKIKASGCPLALSGSQVYNDLCDQMEDKEQGTYLLLSKFSEDVILEYNLEIRDEDFDLRTMTIRTGDGKEYLVDFDKA